MRIDFDIGNRRAEIVVTRFGERQLVVGERVVRRARMWQRARWLVHHEGHTATFVSRFWPWPVHRLLIDGIPDPRVRTLSFASRMPVWIAIFYLLFGLGVTPARMNGLITAILVNAPTGMAVYIMDGAEHEPPGWLIAAMPDADTVVWLRRFKRIFGSERDALLAAAYIYSWNRQPEEAEALVRQASHLSVGELDRATINSHRFLFSSLWIAGACDGLRDLVDAEPASFKSFEVEARIARCRREPIDLLSQEEISVDQDRFSLSRARAALWNDELDVAADMALRDQACPSWVRLGLQQVRFVIAARQDHREELLQALDAVTCMRRCSERLLRNDPLTAPILDDPEILDRVRSACTRPEFPPYDAL
ncbi:MAG: hypothetical protein JST54_26840 [Deltaproteobacteria bacterium]|nr:hypothetical protein [Deltaproteobacteria bacterium]